MQPALGKAASALICQEFVAIPHDKNGHQLYNGWKRFSKASLHGTTLCNQVLGLLCRQLVNAATYWVFRNQIGVEYQDILVEECPLKPVGYILLSLASPCAQSEEALRSTHEERCLPFVQYVCRKLRLHRLRWCLSSSFQIATISGEKCQLPVAEG